jgi:hypothetical protein
LQVANLNNTSGCQNGKSGPTGMGMHVEHEEQEINVSGLPARQPRNVA